MSFDFLDFIDRLQRWADEAFGPGPRTAGFFHRNPTMETMNERLVCL